MKRHAQLVQFQEQGQEQKEEDEDEEGPEAEWNENQYSGGGLVRGYHAEKIACKRQIQIQKALINITVTDRFHTC